MAEEPAGERPRTTSSRRPPESCRSTVAALRRVATASDPGLSRLRLAGTTIATLVVAVVVLLLGVGLVGAPVTVAMPGVVLAMTASMAVRDSAPRAQAVSIMLLVPAAAVAVSLAAVVSGVQLLADAVFVAVAVAAVLLRRLGPRGLPTGLVAFMSYFLSLFVRVQVAQLLVVVGVLAVAGLVTVGVRLLLRPRHPDRDLHRMLRALGIRLGDVVDELVDVLREGGEGTRAARRLAARVGRAADTASMVEQHLDGVDEQLLPDLANEELEVRVFDAQLAVENLAGAVDGLLRANHGAVAEQRSCERALADARAFLDDPAASPGPPRPVRGREAAADGLDLVRFDRAVRLVWETWRAVVDPRSEDPDAEAREPAPASDAGEGPAEESAEPAGSDGVGRQAVQVGIASALAVVVGTQLSSTRWFWAVITAFVVYTGASTRGEILSKGWQRVLGTTGGVVAGVLVAAAVGGHVVVSVVLIALCLFLAVYLMAVSPAAMMFFITTMLALVYGLLGMFSIGLLVLRLEETAAGAVIGIVVSYVVFPSSTRGAAREAIADFLDELADVVDTSAHDLTVGSDARPLAGDRAASLHERFGRLRDTTKPLTEGLAGLGDRAASRRTLQGLAACDHHGRMLSRLADAAPGPVPDPACRDALAATATAVRANADVLAERLRGETSVQVHPAAGCIDRLEQAAALLPGRDRARVLRAARHLRAVDGAVGACARELGVNVVTASEGEPVAGRG